MILSAERLKRLKVGNWKKTMQRSSLVTIKKAILAQQHAQRPYFREPSGEWEVRRYKWGIPISHLWRLVGERVMGPKGEGSVSLKCSVYQGGTDGKSWCLRRNESMREEIGEEGCLFLRARKDGFEDRYGHTLLPITKLLSCLLTRGEFRSWVFWKRKQSLRAVLWGCHLGTQDDEPCLCSTVTENTDSRVRQAVFEFWLRHLSTVWLWAHGLLLCASDYSCLKMQRTFLTHRLQSVRWINICKLGIE